MIIITLFFIGVACKRAAKTQSGSPPKEAADSPDVKSAAKYFDEDSFRQVLQKIEPGENILVEEAFAPLVAKGMSFQTFSHNRPKYPWIIPDHRVNPVQFDYILGRDMYLIGPIVFGDHLFHAHSALILPGKADLLLFKRFAPVADQLRPEMSESDFEKSMESMIFIPQVKKPDNEEKTIRADFMIDKYETTNEQFAYFLSDIGITFDEASVFYSIKDPASKIVFSGNRYRIYKGTDNYPVFNVSFYGAQAFCERYGKRLVNFDEWRKAEGYWDDRRVFPWGSARDFRNRANFKGDDDGYPMWAPVDAFPEGVSPFGVFNMAGNVWEWLEGTVLAGGSWEFAAEPYGRVDEPESNDKLARNLHDGFRCARDAKPR